MVRGIGYLVYGKESMGNRARAILIEHADLEKCLFSSVHANGGSKYSYSSKARISSTFTSTTDTESVGEIVNVKDFVIEILGEPMSVVL